MSTTLSSAARASICAVAATFMLLVVLGESSTASAQASLPYQCELRPPPYGPNPQA